MEAYGLLLTPTPRPARSGASPHVAGPHVGFANELTREETEHQGEQGEE